ncbi:uncharacterized protein LOC117107510 [Anneissia japonica]|uniref:uncharacterized protein LOC117107510 n=1 Tax=Anneissia japonica TaxID=1529436 RepID=UPI0014255A33|nr:uncharacterized protein LOC117107510 [Anneissia japonica]
MQDAIRLGLGEGECPSQKTSAWDAGSEATGVSSVISKGTEPLRLQRLSQAPPNSSHETSRVQGKLVHDRNNLSLFSAESASFDYARNYFEYEEGREEPVVKGRLKASSSFWESIIHANPEVLSIILEGYKLPFYSTPPTANFSNNKSAFEHAEFVTTTILDLVGKGLVKEVRYCA